MTSNKRTCLALIALVLSPLSANAGPIFFNDASAFDTANPGLTLIDFEGIAPSGGTTAYNASSTPGATLNFVNPLVVDSGVCGAASDHFSSNAFNGAGNIAFSPQINAVGFNIALDFASGCGSGGVNGTATVSLYSGATLLDTQTFSTVVGETFSTFAGWSGFGLIDNLRIVINSERDFLSLDNLRYGVSAVSEPGILGLLGIGLLSMGLARRRKQS